MNKDLAKKLDDILKLFPSDNYTTVIKTHDESEFNTVYSLLGILQNDGYIRILGSQFEMPIMLTPKGRVFIENGGYSAVAEAEMKRDEENRKQRETEMLRHLEEDRKKKKFYKSASCILLIASVLYLLITEDYNAYWAYLGTLISLISLFK